MIRTYFLEIKQSLADSRSLTEYQIVVLQLQSLYPAFLKTQLTRFLPKWQSLPDPNVWVKRSLATIGKKRSTPGDLPNIIQVILV